MPRQPEAAGPTPRLSGIVMAEFAHGKAAPVWWLFFGVGYYYADLWTIPGFVQIEISDNLQQNDGSRITSNCHALNSEIVSRSSTT